MGPPVLVCWDDGLLGYDFGPGHPLAPVRLDLTMRLAHALGVLDRPGVRIVAPPAATDDVLALVHQRDYLAAVRRGRPDGAYGLGTPDNPVFAGMHEASARVVGSSVAAAEAVWSGAAQHAVSIAGGLHHAMPGYASGFCIYNDVAVAIATLLERGAQRVAYVDVDVHHGDGVEHVFAADPRVLTISLHQSGRTLFPGTGWPADIGTGAGAGFAVNVALPPGTGDSGWLRAFDAVVPPLIERFAPEILVSQHGCDSSAADPLANLELSVDGQRRSYAMLHDLAHRHAGGRWVATGGGGYAVAEVVPRAWSHLLAIATGEPLDVTAETPADWRAYVTARTGRPAPQRLGDGHDTSFPAWPQDHDPAGGVDGAVAATRAAVFPYHSLATGR